MTCQPQTFTKRKTYTIVNDYKRTNANVSKTKIIGRRMPSKYGHYYDYYYY